MCVEEIRKQFVHVLDSHELEVVKKWKKKKRSVFIEEVGANCSWVLIVDFDSIDTLGEIVETMSKISASN